MLNQDDDDDDDGALPVTGLDNGNQPGVGLHFDDAGHTIWTPRRSMHLDGVICARGVHIHRDIQPCRIKNFLFNLFDSPILSLSGVIKTQKNYQ